jgi:hypothetical protein
MLAIVLPIFMLQYDEKNVLLWRQPAWATKNAGFTIDHIAYLLRRENEVSIEVFVV